MGYVPLYPKVWMLVLFRLHLEILPVRLYLYQGQLNFLISFFGKSSFAEECRLPNDIGGSEMSGRGSLTFGSQTVVEEALLPFFQVLQFFPFICCIVLHLCHSLLLNSFFICIICGFWTIVIQTKFVFSHCKFRPIWVMEYGPHA